MAGIAVINTSRKALDDSARAKKDKLSSIVIDLSENGGGTVRCIQAGTGPFGGEPKTYSFESPESLNQFVASKILGSTPVVEEVIEETPAGDIAEAAEVADGPVDSDDDY